MKKHLIAFVVVPFMALSIALGLLPRLALATTLDEVSFYVDANPEAGLDSKVIIDFTESDGVYSGMLTLQGGVDTNSLLLSWEGDDVSVYFGETPYESGTAPIPSDGETLTYTVSASEETANFTLNCSQSSENMDSAALEQPEEEDTSAQETSTLSNVQIYVDANSGLGLNGRVDISLTKSNNTFSGTLYLPGSVDTNNLKLSWETGLTLTTGETVYGSGEAPIPAAGETATYTITADDGTATLTLNTLQGSASIKALFLNIDESLGTISAMNSDSNHETMCMGSLTLGDKTYYMTIKGRGNTTWSNFTKKPYNITTMKDDTYADKKKTKLISGVESKSWSILANAKDPTCLRNKIGYDIAYTLGIGLPSESIDVWMNGEYLGNYLLTPKNDYQVPKTGYMIELDNGSDENQFSFSGSPTITVKEMPDDLTVTDVKNNFSPAWDALKTTNSDSYLDYFDLDSCAKSYLLQEIYKDVDACIGSKFFTKASMESDAKLTAGPIWDLDGTMGRVSTSYAGIDNSSGAEKSGGGWYIDSIGTGYWSTTPFYQRFGKHDSFMRRVYQLYNEYKNELNGMLSDLQSQRTLIAASAEMNFQRWPQYTTNLEHYSITQSTQTFGSGTYAVTYKKTDSWSAFADNLATYLNVRLTYLSDMLTVTAPTGTITGNTTVDIDDTLTLTADCTANAYQWQSSTDGVIWTDIAGATAQAYSTTATSDMNGLYVRFVATNNGSTISTSRVSSVATSAQTASDSVQLAVNDPSQVQYYTITWLGDGGQELGSTQVEQGTIPSYAGDAPTKASTDEFTYTFTDWYPEPVAATEDATYTAQFSQTKRSYTITWLDGNSGELKVEQVEYGVTPSYTGATPTKTATAQYTYTFNNTWEPAVVSVAGNATYTAKFDATVNSYTVTFVDEDGETVLKEAAAYEYGTVIADIVLPETPTKSSTAQYTYEFAGWDPELVAVTGNATYKATYTATPRPNEIFKQPQDTSANVGERFTLTVEAIGSVKSYSWQASRNGTSWSDVKWAGHDTNTLSYTMTDTLDGRMFRCVVTFADNSTKTSNVATVTLPTPSGRITVQPQDVTVAEGTHFTLSVEAIEATSYSWQASRNGTSWSDVIWKGHDAANLTYTMRESLNGRMFRCVVTFSDGTSEVSAVATLTLAQPTASRITTQPQNATLSVGERFTLSVEATDATSYSWQASRNGTSWSDVTWKGHDAANLTYTMRDSLDGRMFRCVVTFSDGTSEVSDVATLTLAKEA